MSFSVFDRLCVLGEVRGKKRYRPLGKEKPHMTKSRISRETQEELEKISMAISIVSAEGCQGNCSSYHRMP